MAVSLLFGVGSCLLAIAAGYPFVRALRLYGVGKAIQEELPASHVVKAGTPTMGGLLICVTVLIVTLGWSRRCTRWRAARFCCRWACWWAVRSWALWTIGGRC